MNLREGTRRLALLLGVVGAIFGGFASYAELQSVLSQRERHVKFELLANSDHAQKERKCRLLGYASGCFQIKLPPGATLVEQDQKKQAPAKFDPNAPYTAAPDDPYAATAIPIPSVVMKGGIKTINWSHDYGIDSIETEDGQTLYPTLAPSARLYLLVALFPVLGFFIPWGAIRAIGWVTAGFVASPK
jgi:hypothetical protein